MTQEEIQEFNKRCALFLGWKLIKTEDFNKLGEAAYTGDNSNVKWGIIEYLKFDSDWNAIMEVVEKIQILDIVYNNRRSYDSVFKIYECTFSPSYKTNNFGYIKGTSKTNEKEAVVQAINQFLIFYNENTKYLQI